MALQVVLGDPTLRETITYKRYDGRVWSEAEGAQVTTYVDKDITVVKIDHTVKSTLVQAGSVEVGDHAYLFEFADALAGMSLKDIVVNEDGEVESVKQVTPFYGLAVAITVDGGDSGV